MSKKNTTIINIKIILRSSSPESIKKKSDTFQKIDVIILSKPRRDMEQATLGDSLVTKSLKTHEEIHLRKQKVNSKTRPSKDQVSTLIKSTPFLLCGDLELFIINPCET